MNRHHFAYAALIQQQPHLNPTSYLKPGHSVQAYSNQKEIEYISASNVTATLETHPPQLHFTGLFPRDSGDSAIHVHVLKIALCFHVPTRFPYLLPF